MDAREESIGAPANLAYVEHHRRHDGRQVLLAPCTFDKRLWARSLTGLRLAVGRVLLGQGRLLRLALDSDVEAVARHLVREDNALDRVGVLVVKAGCELGPETRQNRSQGVVDTVMNSFVRAKHLERTQRARSLLSTFAGARSRQAAALRARDVTVLAGDARLPRRAADVRLVVAVVADLVAHFGRHREAMGPGDDLEVPLRHGMHAHTLGYTDGAARGHRDGGRGRPQPARGASLESSADRALDQLRSPDKDPFWREKLTHMVAPPD